MTRQQPARVIVAEGDPAERQRWIELIQRAAEARGVDLQIVEVADGDALDRALAEATPTLVMTEIVLERQNALEVLRRRKRDKGQPPAWLAVTCLTTESDRYWALRNGIDGYVRKPYDPPALEGRIRELLLGPKPQRERPA